MVCDPRQERKRVMMLRPGPCAGWTLVFATVLIAGCKLGYVDLSPTGTVAFRIENGTAGSAEVRIVVTASGEGQSSIGAADGSGDVVSSAGSAATTDTVIRVDGGRYSSGELPCGELITISVVSGEDTTTVVALDGDGSGTVGFDSGSVGLGGERFLGLGIHFSCGATILVKILSETAGTLDIVAVGETLPPPLTSSDAAPDSNDPSTVTFRLENATATAADISIAFDGGGPSSDPGPTSIRIPAGEFSEGDIVCGQTYVVSAIIDDDADTPVVFSGDGTGTLGFDGASVGPSGQRLLVFGNHYTCGETVVVRITDDGSGIGASTSDTPLGQINVFSNGDSVPAPDLPDPDEAGGDTGVMDVTIIVVNDVESTIQLNVASGNGNLAETGGVDVTDEFDVRVSPFTTTVGTVACPQEFVLAAAHLEPLKTTFGSDDGSIFTGDGANNFHGIVLTGDGTGTAGFDEESIAVDRGRLLQLNTHFQCGDTITITIDATNNQFKFDSEGNLVTDVSGNPELNYGTGSGRVTVAPTE